MTSPSTTKTRKHVVALIAAAGMGTRLGAQVPKAYVGLHGRTLLERSARAMEESGIVDSLVVTVSPEMEALARDILDELRLPITFVHGGGERADSVWAGLQVAATQGVDDAVVLIHDAARALTPPAMIRRVAEAVLAGAPAVIPVLPVADTIKVVRPAAKSPSQGGVVVSTPDRSQLRAVQTPQAFDLATLTRANQAYFSGQQDFTATDDASLMEWFGVPVRTVEGDPLAFKITTPIDLTLASAILDNNALDL
ncbi:2-C-methyl-D-erythritol 4-phosphate cytidylyltransferase [Corynebacterium sp.]|uniref:2-C-methyl-D-erythritol 4-phosphate cytidylyltransferase n=1 Tax=Corynebacterium sp. TaxID=1720 RepID=UPI0026DD17D8|nr:2-C-methyl-D-erythritol 4-phosphate cytidylyltransferase [Corynebacterium sp.]MDO5032234.1 2-C-methyl-D-erythritol 4-phosphate cytidylyltransferase [Corynebacterium sp.]